MLTPLPWLLGALPFFVQPPQGTRPSLDWNKPVYCLALQPTARVPTGQFRVQCDEARKVCLAAPMRVLVDEVEGEEPLSRVSACEPRVDNARLEHLDPAEWRFEEAVAEAPPGWYRDQAGRVMQVNFDLHRRVFLGGAWAPYGRVDGTGLVLSRARVEVGAEVTMFNRERMHRFHFLEASVGLGAQPKDLRVEATTFRWDVSLRYTKAPFWLTTFVGQPRRFDLPLNFGAWLEAGRVESLGGFTFLTLGEADGTLDLWKSKDFDSYLRLRVGAAAEYDFEDKGVWLRPTAALEGDFTLDDDGFHHLTASAAGEKLYFGPSTAGGNVSPTRVRLRAGYEVILVAINDYPLTLAVDARGTWRDDVPTLRGWEYSLNAGLRFSFWAPSRHLSTQRSVRSAVAPRPLAPTPPQEQSLEQ